MTVPYTFGNTPVGSSIPLSRLDDNFSALGNSTNVSFTQNGTGAISRAAQSKMADVISVKDFGATGNGIADDTEEIQAAINAAAINNTSVLVPSGTYILTNTLTVNASLIFDGGRFSTGHTIKINGTASMLGRNGGGITFNQSSAYIGTLPNTYATQVLCGLDATWSGAIDGMVFNVNNLQDIYLISFWNCNGFEVSNNQFPDLFSVNGGSIIGSPNSSTGITGAMPRSSKNGKIYNNTLKFLDVPTGGQMCGAYESTNLAFFNNTFIGAGDDIINIDSCAAISFCNNYCNTRVGNILVTNTSEFMVIGNTIVKENAQWKSPSIYSAPYTAGGIRVHPIDISLPFVAKNGLIANNLVVNNDALYDMTQPLVVAGSENLTVTNNTFINNRSNANFIFGINNSSSVIPGLFLYNKNLIIKDNLIVRGAYSVNNTGAATTDGIVFVGNIANGGGYPTNAVSLVGFEVTRNDYAANNLGMQAATRSGNLAISGSAYEPRTLLNVFTAAGITTGGFLNAVGTGTYFYVPYETVLDQVTIQFSAATSSSCVVSLYTNNGTSNTLIGTWTLNSGSKAINAVSTNEGVILSSVIVPSGNSVRFSILSAGLGGVDMSVNLYGSKIVFQ